MRHPLHTMLAHFPVACWTLATIGDFASLRYGEPAWHLAGMLVWIGVAFAIPTLFTGVFELIQVPDDPKPTRDAWLHMGIMLATLILYLASGLNRMYHGHLIAPDTATLVTSALGLACLLVGGWLGGGLVYGYGVGTSKPQR